MCKTCTSNSFEEHGVDNKARFVPKLWHVFAVGHHSKQIVKACEFYYALLS
jgi:hypothetical protein